MTPQALLQSLPAEHRKALTLQLEDHPVARHLLPEEAHEIITEVVDNYLKDVQLAGAKLSPTVLTTIKSIPDAVVRATFG